MIRPERWSPADDLTLEPNALLAARETVRNLALTAGPGAGKTEMLAQRADFLLRTGTCRYPKRILAISAKVDAAQNLKARVRMRCGYELAARLDSYTFHAFAKKLIDRFRLVLKGWDALDADYSVGTNRIQRKSITFKDMVPLAMTIIESSEIARNAVRQTYSDIFLDEFQDCTNEQYKLIVSCFKGTDTRLTAVGDTKQRIMGWAGALEGIFQKYADEFGAVPLNLYQNFRSLPRLRRMQNRMVRVMDVPAALKDDQIPGNGGEIDVLRFANDEDEAQALAELIQGWIQEENVHPSDIAVLVSKQQNLYCIKLREALEELGVPFREEDNAQDIAAEPVARLIVDFLLVASGTRQPEPHRRLLDMLVFNHGYDEEHEYQLRARWARFITDMNQRLSEGKIGLDDKNQLIDVVAVLFEEAGRDAVVALSPDYAHGNRLQQVIDQTIERVSNLLTRDPDAISALASFSGDRAVRIMSIHKSKGLEFDSVIVFGVEKETFWGGIVDERSAYFVGVSRAKRRLVLAVAAQRPRPEGANQFWKIARTEQAEFVGYVAE